MKITQEFVVSQSPDAVWHFFQDVPSVAQCLPGSELLGESEGGAYEGRLSVRLGPMTAAFEGTAVVSPDHDSRTASIDCKGVDRRGGSRGQAKLSYAVAPHGPDATTVTVDADITLSGPAAQFGRTGLINEMSKRLIGEFVSCLEAKLAAPTHAAAEAITASRVSGISLFLSSLWASFKRLFTRER
jgi:carbon monoxide dehydrogenase subunit G